MWHLPNDPDAHTTLQLVDIIYRHAGQLRAELRAVPALLLRTLGVVNPSLRELVEMQYQFDEPFIVDSSKIASRLSVQATPIDQALADTLTSYATDAHQPRPRPKARTRRAYSPATGRPDGPPGSSASKPEGSSTAAGAIDTWRRRP